MPSTGQLAELKGRIQEHLNAQAKQAHEHLEGLKGRAEHAQAQAAADLRAKKGAAEQQLRELKQAGDEQWNGSRRLGSGRGPI
jgi:ElaB/YqjD/DUF883 family membrane-anchored ribosome-binding protein